MYSLGTHWILIGYSRSPQFASGLTDTQVDLSMKKYEVTHTRGHCETWRLYHQRETSRLSHRPQERNPRLICPVPTEDFPSYQKSAYR